VPTEREPDGVAEALARVTGGVEGDTLSEDTAEGEDETVSITVDAYCNVLVGVVCNVDGVEEVSSTFEEPGDKDADADEDDTDDEASEEALTAVVSVLATPSLCDTTLLDSIADTALTACASEVAATAVAG
jgi:hypothetical protein